MKKERKTPGSSASMRLASFLLAICMLLSLLPMSDIAKAVGAPETFSQVNEVVAQYLEAAASYDVDSPTSVAKTYYDMQTDYMKDRPAGYTIASAAGGTVAVTGNGSAWTDSTSADSYTIYNLVPGVTYHYVAKDSSNNVVSEGDIQATGVRRMIYIPNNSIRNIRDIGGMAADGGTVKYGLIYRGYNLDYPSAADIKILHDNLGIRTEVDLRESNITAAKNGVSKLGSDVDYFDVDMRYSNFNTDELNLARYYEVMSKIMDEAIAGNPSYFHCAIGCDRTGQIGFITEAVLGVSLKDIAIDYELSTFCGNERLWTNSTWKTMKNQLLAFDGATTADKAATFLLKCGIPIEKINAFRAAMIDGTPNTLVATQEPADPITMPEYDPSFTGIAHIGNNLYYFENGMIKTGVGLIKLGDYYYYVHGTGEVAHDVSYGVSASKTNGLMPAGTYNFDSEGRMTDPFDENKNGIFEVAGSLYYYVNGVQQMDLGLIEYEGNYYYVRTHGQLARDEAYTVSEAKANGLKPANSYGFDHDGKMITGTGLYQLGNKKGYFVDGIFTKSAGMIEHEGDWYYIDGTGFCVQNRVQYINASYLNDFPYYDKTGNYKFAADGKFDKDYTGVMPDANGTLRYFESGIAKSQRKIIKWNGNYYYVSGSGVVTVNGATTVNSSNNGGTSLPDGVYYSGSDGVIDLTRTGIFQEGTALYYYEDGRRTAKGLIQDANGDYYFARSGGVIAVNQDYAISVDKSNGLLPAGTYHFGSDGKMYWNGMYPEGDSLRLYTDGVKNTSYTGLYTDPQDGTLYYLEGGLGKSQSVVKGGDYYYFAEENGVIAKDKTVTVTDDNSNGLIVSKDYVAGPDGKLAVEPGDRYIKEGIFEENGNLYLYLNDMKVTAQGAYEYDGKLYYVNSSGYLERNSLHLVKKAYSNGLLGDTDRYWKFGPDGAIETDYTGILKWGNNYWYIKDGGSYYAGLFFLDGYYYYAGSSGPGVLKVNVDYNVTKTNQLMPVGTYHFDELGRMTNPPTVTVRWYSDSGVLLKTDEIPQGSMPEYTGETPTREPIGTATFSFTGWAPEVTYATSDQEYQAVFKRNESSTPYGYVSNIVMTEILDGVGVLDMSDTPGNDSSRNNHLVRTFDSTVYTVNVTTRTLDPTAYYNTGMIWIEAELDKDITEAKFQPDQMRWMNEYTLTYYDAAGNVLAEGASAVPDYNANKVANGSDAGTESYRTPVAKQVLRAAYIMTADENNPYAVPGTKDLSFYIKTLIAKNGDTMQPVFRAYMDGNEQNIDGSGTVKSSTLTPPVVTVSAKPRYDVKVISNYATMNKPGRWDLLTGEAATSESNPENVVTGNLVGYGLGIYLYNETDNKESGALAAKGRMGIEYPQGDITFQVDFREALSKTDGTVPAETGFTPILWDVRTFYTGDTQNYGLYGRNMSLGNTTGAHRAYYVPYTYYPPNITEEEWIRWLSDTVESKPEKLSCYNGGTWSILTPKETNKNVYSGMTSPTYSIKVQDYDFEVDALAFPIGNRGENTVNGSSAMKTYLGGFSAAYMQVIMQYDMDLVPEGAEDLYLVATAHDFQATSLSGNPVDYETTLKNNNNAQNTPISSPGTITKYNRFCANKEKNGNFTCGDWLGKAWSSGIYFDATAYAGDSIWISGEANMSGASTNIITEGNLLQKFDSEAFTIDPSRTIYSSYSYSVAPEGYNPEETYLYAADPLYPDGWDSNDPNEMERMNTALEEDLIYFSSLDDLESAGYTCIGILSEFRHIQIAGGGSMVTYIPVICSSGEEFIGKTYATVNTFRAWTLDAAEDQTWLNGEYDESTHKNTDSSYHKPQYRLDTTTFVKAEFDDGILREGTSFKAPTHGETLLLVGYESKIEIVSDKSAYDMDKNQRIATYTVKGMRTDISSEEWTRLHTDTVSYTNLNAVITLDENQNFVSNSFTIDGNKISGDRSNPSVISAIYTDGEKNEHPYTYTIWYEQTSAHTVKFHMSGVAVSNAVSNIEFQATIGYPGQINDVVNNQIVKATAEISGDADMRAHIESGGNYSENTFTIIRLASTAAAKDVDKNLVEQDEPFTYTVTYINRSNSPIGEFLLQDVLPFNGDDRGTDFHGTYKVTSINAQIEREATEPESQNVTIFYTTQDSETIDVEPSGWASFATTYSNLAAGPGENVTFVNTGNADITGIAIHVSKIAALKKVTLTYTIQPEGNIGRDVYGNNAHSLIVANGPESMVRINTVQTSVVDRRISGLVWIDKDKDGLQDKSETRLDGVKVSLLKWNSSTNSYEPVCYAGTSTPMVIETGNEVSYRGTSTMQTYNIDGGYRFSELPAGQYAVKFEGGTTAIDEFIATTVDAGSDDSIDSDAEGVMVSDVLQHTHIDGIVLPELADMEMAVFESDNHDSGLTYPTDFEFTKVDAKNMSKALEGAEFTLTAGSGSAGSYVWNGTAENATSDKNGKVVFESLQNGVYKLEETKAPSGYLKPSGYWIVTVNSADHANPVTISAVGNVNAFAVDGTTMKLPNNTITSIPFTGNSMAFLLPGISAAALITAMLSARISKKKAKVKAGN